MTEIAVAVGVILFPGVISALVADKIVVHVKPWGAVKYGLYAFVLGTTCYFALQALFLMLSNSPDALAPPDWMVGPLQVWDIVEGREKTVVLHEVFGASLFSAPVAFIAAFLVNHKVFHRIAKRIGVSNKYGDENLYSFYLNSQEVDWVYVRDFERKLTYQGRVVSFSENDTMQELVMSDVTVFGYEDSEEYYSVPSLYISRTAGMFSVESIPLYMLEEVNGEEAN